jgi:hypothetical protein
MFRKIQDWALQTWQQRRTLCGIGITRNKAIFVFLTPEWGDRMFYVFGFCCVESAVMLIM